jgi:hypothetical protein
MNWVMATSGARAARKKRATPRPLAARAATRARRPRITAAAPGPRQGQETADDSRCRQGREGVTSGHDAVAQTSAQESLATQRSPQPATHHQRHQHPRAQYQARDSHMGTEGPVLKGPGRDVRHPVHPLEEAVPDHVPVHPPECAPPHDVAADAVARGVEARPQEDRHRAGDDGGGEAAPQVEVHVHGAAGHRLHGGVHQGRLGPVMPGPQGEPRHGQDHGPQPHGNGRLVGRPGIGALLPQERPDEHHSRRRQQEGVGKDHHQRHTPTHHPQLDEAGVLELLGDEPEEGGQPGVGERRQPHGNAPVRGMSLMSPPSSGSSRVPVA